jgi:hypothetical protein
LPHLYWGNLHPGGVSVLEEQLPTEKERKRWKVEVQVEEVFKLNLKRTLNPKP